MTCDALNPVPAAAQYRRSPDAVMRLRRSMRVMNFMMKFKVPHSASALAGGCARR